MALTVTYHNPVYPDDYEFGVEGLGLFKNGESREVTEEQEQAFVSSMGMLVNDAFENNEMFSVEGEPTVTEVPEEALPEEESGEEEEGTGTETEGEDTTTEEEESASA